ncbi:MAG: hypothetical protein ACOZQL_03450 [Myxococcota bacterium]
MELKSYFATAPHLVDAVTGTRVWFFDRTATVVNQTLTDMNVAVAQFLSGPVEQEVQRRWPGKKVHYVHDWRSCLRYDAEARELLLSWAKYTRPHARQSTLTLSPQASIFIRIAATTGVSLLRAGGVPIELVEDLGPLARELEAS